MIFYLGTHMPQWLDRTRVPLFISRRRLCHRRSVPRALGRWALGRWALGRWALDSGGFSELSMFGEWRTTPVQYADEVQAWQERIGQLDWAAIQDWMCEPFMIAKTGKSVREHQELTVQNYLDLKALAPDVRWTPVLQGWRIPDYFSHAEMYRQAGVDLQSFTTVGVGSVCRRQSTQEGVEIFAELKSLDLRMHGFGLKLGFIKRAWGIGLTSFDSLAWSYRARRHGRPMEGCSHATCANCMRWATTWRDAVISVGNRPKQLLLSMGCRDADS